jgi:hypothetical protein
LNQQSGLRSDKGITEEEIRFYENEKVW